MIYRPLFRLLLRRIEPERAHALAAEALRVLTAVPGMAAVLRRTLARPDPCLRVAAFGREYPTPLGVAAGLDKGASWYEGLGALGFGFVEVGTVTALPQVGNDPPRVLRVVGDRALINRMGFPNPGAAVVAARIARRRRVAVGVNVGRSKRTPARQAADDYRACVRELAGAADYVALNVSSPNTPGLRDLQAAESLRGLVEAVRDELPTTGRRLPVVLKIAPDLGDDELDAIADLALDLSLDGIIATNTTTSRAGLSADRRAERFEGGGVSGAPLARRSLAVLRRLRARTGGALVLVSAGGVESADDVLERILAGATLVQSYTGFVYGGPGWPRRVNRALARRVRERGASTIGELVGREAPARPLGSNGR